MTMPAALADVVSDFNEMQGQDKLQLLLEFANELPPLPSDLEEAAMEPVPECQSPLFLHVDAADRDRVRLYFSAPAEAPTTRGFASILVQGITGLTADEVLAIPDDYPQSIGLTKAVSPLRIGGMTGMLMRAKKQVTQKR